MTDQFKHTFHAGLCLLLLGAPAVGFLRLTGQLGEVTMTKERQILPGPTTRTPSQPLVLAQAPEYPRIASLYAYKDAKQAATFARYGEVVAPISAGQGSPSAITALKRLNPSIRVFAYVDARQVNAIGDAGSYEGLTIYPGWWLTLAGTTLSGAIDASTRTIFVANASPIASHLATNPYVLIGEETVKVVVVDVSQHTLVVQRGIYSPAVAHPAGTRIAAHMSAWPGTWMLNVTRSCPPDPKTGLIWTSYLAHYVARLMTSASWDGVFYDDVNSSIQWMAGGAIDADNNNKPDGGSGPSGNSWGNGIKHLLEFTHELVPKALVLGNGGYYDGLSNGREFERFASLPGDWRHAFASYLRIAAPTSARQSSVVNPDTGDTGVQSLQRMRFGLATALMGSGYFAYDFGVTSHGQTWWYDEYDNGAGSSLAATLGWTDQTLTLAPGTGVRFRPGDVVRVPNDIFSNAGLSIDDEQLRVLAVHGDSLVITRGYNGTFVTSHAMGTKVMTQAQIIAGREWLGYPLGPPAPLPIVGPNQLPSDDFHGLGSSWLSHVVAPASADIGTDTTRSTLGTGVRVRVSHATSDAPWDVALFQPRVSLTDGMTYTLSFEARATQGRVLEVVLQQNMPPWSVSTAASYSLSAGWRNYILSFKQPMGGSNFKVQFNLAKSTGTVWINAVRLQEDNLDVWRRDFTHGTVILNGTASTQTVLVGPGLHRIAGTQDRLTNTGAQVSTVTLHPYDAIILVKSR